MLGNKSDTQIGVARPAIDGQKHRSLSCGCDHRRIDAISLKSDAGTSGGFMGLLGSGRTEFCKLSTV